MVLSIRLLVSYSKLDTVLISEDLQKLVLAVEGREPRFLSFDQFREVAGRCMGALESLHQYCVNCSSESVWVAKSIPKGLRGLVVKHSETSGLVVTRGLQEIFGLETESVHVNELCVLATEHIVEVSRLINACDLISRGQNFLETKGRFALDGYLISGFIVFATTLPEDIKEALCLENPHGFLDGPVEVRFLDIFLFKKWLARKPLGQDRRQLHHLEQACDYTMSGVLMTGPKSEALRAVAQMPLYWSYLDIN